MTTVLVLNMLTDAVQLSTPVPALLRWTFCGDGLKPLPETKHTPPATPPKNGTPAPSTVSVTGTVIAVDPLLKMTCPAYMPADSVVAFTLIEQAAGVGLRPHCESTCNQAPPPAVC